MSAQASKAAREIAYEAWNVDCIQGRGDIPRLARMIDEALADLLEKAQRREWLIARIVDDLPSNRDWLDPSLELEARNDTSLKLALEPWKAGE